MHVMPAYPYSYDEAAGEMQEYVSSDTMELPPTDLLDDLVAFVNEWMGDAPITMLTEHDADPHYAALYVVDDQDAKMSALHARCTFLMWCATCSTMLLACMCTMFACNLCHRRAHASVPRVTVVDATPLEVVDSKQV